MMKARLLIAFFAISSVAIAQNRGGISRVEGRQQNDAYSYTNYSYQSDSFYRMNLSYSQKAELVRLLEDKAREAKVIRRSYSNPHKKLAELEHTYDRKIYRLLNKNQYNTWLRYYAAQHSVATNTYRYA